MRLHHARLRTKGWSEEEIRHAEEVLHRAEERKHPVFAALEKLVFWGLLFLMIVGVCLISFVLVPALLMLSTPAVALVLLFLGLSLGALFAVIIRDIHWLERHHHTLAATLLVCVGILSVSLMVVRTNRLGIGEAHAPLALGAVFAAALLAPYAIHLATANRVRPWI